MLLLAQLHFIYRWLEVQFLLHYTDTAADTLFDQTVEVMNIQIGRNLCYTLPDMPSFLILKDRHILPDTVLLVRPIIMQHLSLNLSHWLFLVDCPHRRRHHLIIMLSMHLHPIDHLLLLLQK
jgi:hypothetical protein